MSLTDDLKEELMNSCGNAYGSGMTAQEVVTVLDDVRERFELLAEVDE
jgi:hypothetical protein